MSNNEKYRTSEEWCKTIKDVVVLDPDGWDRSNFQHSWCEEEITLETYFNRLSWSTCHWLEDPIKVKQRWRIL